MIERDAAEFSRIIRDGQLNSAKYHAWMAKREAIAEERRSLKRKAQFERLMDRFGPSAWERICQ